MDAEKYIVTQSQYLSQEMLDLLNKTYFAMANWKWIALVAMILVGISIRPLLKMGLQSLKELTYRKLEDRDTFFHRFLETPLEKALSWIIIYGTWLVLLDAMEPSAGVKKHFSNLFVVFLCWFCIKLTYNAVDALGKVFAQNTSRTNSAMDDMLIPFVTKTLKVLVVILGFLALLQNLGVNVFSLLAGLGIGGLAIALAAQDTAANVFGSITIFMDQPFRVGDWIKVQDVEGTVEEIGFRSTRIRTFYNSVITIPNSVVAKEKVDNLGLRPLRRIRHSLGITYSTPVAKIEEFCSNIRYLISQEPHVDQSNITVAFNGYGDSSLNILVNFHINVTDANEELKIQQKILLDILALAEQMKVDFAFPTRTLIMESAT